MPRKIYIEEVESDCDEEGITDITSIATRLKNFRTSFPKELHDFIDSLAKLKIFYFWDVLYASQFQKKFLLTLKDVGVDITAEDDSGYNPFIKAILKRQVPKEIKVDEFKNWSNKILKILDEKTKKHTEEERNPTNEILSRKIILIHFVDLLVEKGFLKISDLIDPFKFKKYFLFILKKAGFAFDPFADAVLKGEMPENMAFRAFRDWKEKVLSILNEKKEEILNDLLMERYEICRLKKIERKDLSLALHRAFICDRLDLVEFLIKHEGVVNEKDENGKTPLHIAAETSHAVMLEMLLAHGADTFAVDNTGKSPLECITQKGYQDEKEVIDFNFLNNQFLDLTEKVINTEKEIRDFIMDLRKKGFLDLFDVLYPFQLEKKFNLLLKEGMVLSKKDETFKRLFLDGHVPASMKRDFKKWASKIKGVFIDKKIKKSPYQGIKKIETTIHAKKMLIIQFIASIEKSGLIDYSDLIDPEKFKKKFLSLLNENGIKISIEDNPQYNQCVESIADIDEKFLEECPIEFFMKWKTIVYDIFMKTKNRPNFIILDEEKMAVSKPTSEMGDKKCADTAALPLEKYPTTLYSSLVVQQDILVEHQDTEIKTDTDSCNGVPLIVEDDKKELKMYCELYALSKKEDILKHADMITEWIDSRMFFIIDFLVKKYTKPDTPEFSMDQLWEQALLAHEPFLVPLVRLLIKQRLIDINAFHDSGENLLHMAIRFRNVGVFELLVEAGADLELGNQTGKTPQSMIWDTWKDLHDPQQFALDVKGVMVTSLRLYKANTRALPQDIDLKHRYMWHTLKIHQAKSRGLPKDLENRPSLFQFAKDQYTQKQGSPSAEPDTRSFASV